MILELARLWLKVLIVSSSYKASIIWGEEKAVLEGMPRILLVRSFRSTRGLLKGIE